MQSKPIVSEQKETKDDSGEYTSICCKTESVVRVLCWAFAPLLCLGSLFAIFFSFVIIVGLTNYGKWGDSTDCKLISEITRPNSPLIMTHRGYIESNLYQEDTLNAVIESYALGFPPEIDLWRTSDDKIVVFHDQNMKRVTGINANIDEMSSVQISQIKIKQNVEGVIFKNESRIPLLSQVLGHVCNISNADYIYLDIKGGISHSIFINDNDKTTVNLILDVMKQSKCSDLLNFVFLVESVNVAAVSYIKSQWKQLEDNGDVLSQLVTVYGLYPVYPLGMFFWLKTRFHFALISEAHIDVFVVHREDFHSYIDIFQDYQNKGYCISIYYDQSAGYHSFEELGYDEYFNNTEDVCNPDIIIVNQDKQTWMNMSRNATTDTYVYDYKNKEYQMYILVVFLIVFGWVMSCALCGLCIAKIYQKRKKREQAIEMADLEN